MVYESMDHESDITCHAVPVVLFLVFRKNIFSPQHGQRRPNFNIWRGISDSESVLEAAKVEQKYEKQQKNVASRSDFPRNFAGN